MCLFILIQQTFSPKIPKKNRLYTTFAHAWALQKWRVEKSKFGFVFTLWLGAGRQKKHIFNGNPLTEDNSDQVTNVIYSKKCFLDEFPFM
jgi:hypothetical protein